MSRHTRTRRVTGCIGHLGRSPPELAVRTSHVPRYGRDVVWPGSSAVMGSCRPFRPVALRPHLSMGLPFAADTSMPKPGSCSSRRHTATPTVKLPARGELQGLCLCLRAVSDISRLLPHVERRITNDVCKTLKAAVTLSPAPDVECAFAAQVTDPVATGAVGRARRGDVYVGLRASSQRAHSAVICARQAAVLNV
jgi:hypothetical protein